MRFFISSVVLMLMCGHLSYAQSAKVKRYKVPLAGTVILSDVEDKYNANVSSKEMPEPDADAEQAKLQEIKREVSERYPRRRGPRQKKTSSVASPTLGINFITDSFGQIPPDNCSAISVGYKAITVLNSNFVVHDANTGAFLYVKGLKPFTMSVGLNGSPSTNYRFDPKILYDQGADRFICIMLNNASSGSNWIVVGFSQTNDPAGTWNFYKFFGNFTDDTTWFDYPAFAVTKDELFFTGNHIKDGQSWQAGFTRTVIYQVRKQGGYNGDAMLDYQIWDSVAYGSKNLRCLHPITPADSLQGPSQYFLSNRNFDVTNDTIFLVKIPDTIGSASNVLTVTPIVSPVAYGVPPNGIQPDTSVTLATNDGRVLGAIVKDEQVQFVSVTSNPANGNAAVYHGVINNYSTTPTITAQIYSVDTLDLGYPNISYTGGPSGANQAIISLEYTGPNTYPGMGAIFYDGIGHSDILKIKQGDSSIKVLSGKEQRWGDYSGTQPDWTLGGAVWVEGIYGRKNKSYGSYMAQVLSPYHVGVTTPVAKPAIAKLYPNPAVEYLVYEFAVNEEQVFDFYIYSMDGKLVDKLVESNCMKGQNVLRFNIAPLAPGTYVLQARGKSGENIPSKVFVRR